MGPRNRLISPATRSISDVSHSQTTCTRHPSATKAATFRSSRRALPSSLLRQNSRRVFGSRFALQPSCRCQKQPCTKTTFRRDRNTRSGRPGKSFACSRYRYPIPCTRRRTSNSGLVSFERILLINSLRWRAESWSRPIRRSDCGTTPWLGSTRPLCGAVVHQRCPSRLPPLPKRMRTGIQAACDSITPVVEPPLGERIARWSTAIPAATACSWREWR